MSDQKTLRKNEEFFNHKFNDYNSRIEKLNAVGVITGDKVDLDVNQNVIKYFPYSALVKKEYSSHLFERDRFNRNVPLDYILNLHLFESNYNSFMLKYILFVESSLKDSISYILSHRYGHYTDHRKNIPDGKPEKSTRNNLSPGPDDYLFRGNYSVSNKSVDGILTDLVKFVRNPPPYASNVIHFKNNESNLPSYIVLSDLMFKNTIDWYYILKREDKMFVLKNVLMTPFEKEDRLKQKQEQLILDFSIKGFRLINELRNKCAHMIEKYSFDTNNYKDIQRKELINWFPPEMLTKDLFDNYLKQEPQSMSIIVMFVMLDNKNRMRMLSELFTMVGSNALKTYGISYEDAIKITKLGPILEIFERIFAESDADDDLDYV